MRRAIAFACLTLASMSQVAIARQFDLECAELSDENTTRPDPLHAMHFQVDEDTRQFCQWECRSPAEVANISQITGSEIVFVDEPYAQPLNPSAVSRRTFRYDRASHDLYIEILMPEAVQKRKFVCSEEEFGQFKPYLARLALLRSYSFIGPKDRIRGANGQFLTGTVELEFEIDSTGQARSCNVVRSSGSLALDQHTCQIALGRARFYPARDRHGAAINSRLIKSFRWMP